MPKEKVTMTKAQLQGYTEDVRGFVDAEWKDKLVAKARTHHKTMNAEIKLGQYAAIDVTNYHKGARDALLKAAGKGANYFQETEQEDKK